MKDKVIIGTGGGDGPIRGYISAFDAKTGKEVWRFYTIPGPGEPGNETWSGDSWKTGGVGVWNAGAYDPETNLVFFGTGNPAPDWDGSTRLGDNLYSDSVVALDADTGKLKWHYQFTPHDELDYDSTQVPVLADIQWQGKPRKVMLWANRNGVMYVLDRVDRRVPQGQAVREDQLARRLRRQGPAEPREVPDAGGHARLSARPRRHQLGAAVVQPAHGALLRRHVGELRHVAGEGQFPRDGERQHAADGDGADQPRAVLQQRHRALSAWCAPTTRRRSTRSGNSSWATSPGAARWSPPATSCSAAAATATSWRSTRKTGALLWKATVGGQINAGAMSYAVNGKQYVAIAAGNALFAYALP